MLLVFFLVTTSIDSDKGLVRQLPPMPQTEQQQDMNVKESDVLRVVLDGADRLSCNDTTVTAAELRERVKAFVFRKPQEHIISVQADRNTSYEAYFDMQNAIVEAYHELRDDLSRHRYGRPYRRLNQEQHDDIISTVPQRISESLPTEEGGEP